MPMRFIQRDNEVLLRYKPYALSEDMCAKLRISFDDEGRVVRHTPGSLPDELKALRPATQLDASLTVKRVFTFVQDDLVDSECDCDELVFRFAQLDEAEPEYYRVPAHVFDCPQDVLLGRDMFLDWRQFCVGYQHRTSTIKVVSQILDESERQIRIGGPSEDAIPEETFRELVGVFPTTTELEKYGRSLIERYVQDYLTTKKDYGEQYRKSLERRNLHRQPVLLGSPWLDEDRAVVLKAARDQLHDLLVKSDSTPEELWQQGILSILPALFPQYVAVLPKVRIKDVLNGGHREIDYLLVDASGNVDILEIKRAFPKNCLLMCRTYRNNYMPARELSGGIMQIEKYIHLLLNWGAEGERELTKRYADRLPAGLKMRFLNPRC